MTHIHWYPGHIAKAQKQLKEKLNLVDVIIEVVDARIPYSSKYKTTDKLCPNKPKIILMNKADLSDEKYNKMWADIYRKKYNCEVIVTSLLNKKDINIIIDKVLELSNLTMQRRIEKGLLPRATRTMVIGMPNVGKSSTINKLIKKAKTKTGAKAGVTRQQQWIRINDKIELLDTPGIIPTVQDDQKQAIKLAFVNSIGEKAYDSEYVAEKLIEILSKLYTKDIKQYFNFSQDETDINIEKIALKRNWILKGEKADTLRTSNIILSCFREGKIGKFTLDRPEEYGLI